MNREDIFVQSNLYNATLPVLLLKDKYDDVRIEILEREIIEANYYISKKLDIPLASKVWYTCELVYVEGYPVMYGKYYVNMDEMEDLGIHETNSMDAYEFIYKYKYVNTLTTDEEVLIVKANEQEQKYLQLKENEEIALFKGNVYFDNASKQSGYFESSCLTTVPRLRSVGEND